MSDGRSSFVDSVLWEYLRSVFGDKNTRKHFIVTHYLYSAVHVLLSVRFLCRFKAILASYNKLDCYIIIETSGSDSLLKWLRFNKVSGHISIAIYTVVVR